MTTGGIHRVRKIVLTNGGVALVDDEDFILVNRWNWQRCRDGYATRCQSLGKRGMTKTIFMHREVLQQPNGVFTDHINHNRLDNRRSNLRVCNRQQNNVNKSKQRNNTSGYVGVTKEKNAWKAFTYFDNRRIHIACSKNLEDAAYMRDQVVVQPFGEFAKTNFSYV